MLANILGTLAVILIALVALGICLAPWAALSGLWAHNSAKASLAKLNR
jgi:hypothetical protein